MTWRDHVKGANRAFSIRKYWPVLLFLAILLFYHFLMQWGKGDDAFYARILSSAPGEMVAQYQVMDNPVSTWLHFLVTDYSEWSSRVVLESISIILLQFPLLWKLLNIGIWMLLLWSFLYLTEIGERETGVLIAVACVMQMPFYASGETGWVTTGSGYVWTFSLGLYAAVIIKDVLSGTSVSVKRMVLTSAALFYAVSEEQICGMACVLFAAALVCAVIAGKEWAKLLPHVAVCLAGLAFILLSPGSSSRKQVEIAARMPEYVGLNLLEKLQGGFVRSMNIIAGRVDIIVILMAAVICIAVWKCYRNTLLRLLSVFPLIMSMGRSIISRIYLSLGEEAFPLLAQHPAFLENGNVNWNYCMLFFSVFSVTVTAGLLLILFQSRVKGIMVTVALIMGLASDVVMGFSPTLYASGFRTHIPFWFTATGATLFVISEHRLWELLPEKAVKLTAALMIIFAFANVTASLLGL